MHIVSLAFLFAWVGLPSAANISAAAQNLRSSDTCGDQTTAVPFYRSYNSAVVDHFHTTDVILVSDALNYSGYALQAVAGMVFVTPEESTAPFYRLFSMADSNNFYTMSTTERDIALKNGYGLITRDPLIYIYPAQVCGSVPFYHLYHSTTGDHLYPTSETERLAFISTQGYQDVDIAGYLLPLEVAQCG
ncbi:hypothetical protein B0H17DRAFT_1194577 [Mycena rosella]|uniref:DUF5648 domain-containing protein n=1 Tax=Mycena rosella TaxID=1033263 RepID=A0AAD7DZT2_MYCRO|nr:hypothetical protein B0H17DRAFT_1194577 [Mycena rosella]